MDGPPLRSFMAQELDNSIKIMWSST